MVSFEVPGRPVGKQRARTVLNQGRVHSYTPVKTVNYEAHITMAYTNKYGAYRFGDDEPINVMIAAYFTPPTSVSKKMRTAMLKGSVRPKVKPDVDNIAKSVLDALNGVAFKDDSRVCSLIIHKFYAETDKLVIDIWRDRDGVLDKTVQEGS